MKEDDDDFLVSVGGWLGRKLCAAEPAAATYRLVC